MASVQYEYFDDYKRKLNEADTFYDIFKDNFYTGRVVTVSFSEDDLWYTVDSLIKIFKDLQIRIIIVNTMGIASKDFVFGLKNDFTERLKDWYDLVKSTKDEVCYIRNE